MPPLRAQPNVEVIGVFRAPTISSIDTDATADDLPGAGRTVGRFLSWIGLKLENSMNKRAERAGFGPKAVADEICRLAGHRQIFLRPEYCNTLLPVAPGRKFNKPETKALQKLCQKLFGYATSHVTGNQLVALEEIIEISIKDPRIRAIFARSNLELLITHYDEPDLLMATQRALGAIEFSHVHRVWAPIIFHCTMLRTYDCRQSSVLEAENLKLSALKEDIFETIRNPSTSFLAARYYKSAVNRSTLGTPDRLITLLNEVGNLYAIVASNQLQCIESSTFQSCLTIEPWEPEGVGIYIHHHGLIKLAKTLDFADLIHLISSYLIREFPADPNHVRHSVGNSDDLIKLVSRVTKSSECDFHTHLSFVDHWRVSSVAKRYLGGTIFAERVSYTYCVILHYTIKYLKNETRFPEVSILRDMCAPLVSIMNSDFSNDCSLATIFTEKFCAVSRYCKTAALQAAQEVSAETYLSLQQIMTSTHGKQRLGVGTLLFEYPWTLLRVFYRESGTCCYIGDEYQHSGSPEKAVSKCRRRYNFQDIICADIMSFEDKAIFISVNGDLDPFCASGHYPVLAFSNDQSSRSFYIARVRTENLVCYYTCVEDGAFFVTYQREEEEEDGSGGYVIKRTEERTSKFDVLVLRYDPEDYRFEHIDEGLSDPTGPLGWRNVYKTPKYDP